MKITINTKEDSHEDIKKVISLLTHLIGETPRTNANIFDSSEPEVGGLMSMFDSPPTPPPETEKVTQEKIRVIPY